MIHHSFSTNMFKEYLRWEFTGKANCCSKIFYFLGALLIFLSGRLEDNLGEAVAMALGIVSLICMLIAISSLIISMAEYQECKIPRWYYGFSMVAFLLLVLFCNWLMTS